MDREEMVHQIAVRIVELRDRVNKLVVDGDMYYSAGREVTWAITEGKKTRILKEIHFLESLLI